MSGVNMMLLYRNILKAAARFPSIKRDAIIQDIKLEFRANKGMTDPAEILKHRKLAFDSLSQLQDFAGMDRTSTEDWEVSLAGARI